MNGQIVHLTLGVPLWLREHGAQPFEPDIVRTIGGKCDYIRKYLWYYCTRYVVYWSNSTNLQSLCHQIQQGYLHADAGELYALFCGMDWIWIAEWV